MTKELTPLRKKDIETGRKLEREAIVKWIGSLETQDGSISMLWDEMICCIQDGEHLK